MSNENKKALLNEATTKRFWKLAGLKPIHEKAYVFEEDEELEEGMYAKKEDDEKDLEERSLAKEDDKEDRKKMEESEELDEGDRGDRMGREDKEDRPKKKKMEESEDIDEMGMSPAMADEDEPEMDMDDEGPEDGQDVEVDVPEGDVASLKTARDILDQILAAVEGGGDEDMGMDDEALEEEVEDDLNEVDQEELEEVAERIAARVAKRIQESFIKKNK